MPPVAAFHKAAIEKTVADRQGSKYQSGKLKSARRLISPYGPYRHFTATRQ